MKSSGVVCVVGIVNIHGKTLEVYEKQLDAFFGRCREKNVKLSKEKLVLHSDNIRFMEHKVR